MINSQTHTAVADPAPSQAKRKIVRSSKGHFVGQLVYQLMGLPQVLAFESLLEYHAALCFIYMFNVVEVEEQIAAIAFRKPNGSPGLHYFDFRVTFRGGRRIAIAVKPEHIAQRYKFVATMRAVASATTLQIADGVFIVTERNIDPVLLHNAKLYHAARHIDLKMDQRIQDGLKNVLEPIRIADFLEKVGCFGAGYFSLVRCIRFGHALHVDGGRIAPASMIMTGRAQ
jgi:hypothetical protein